MSPTSSRFILLLSMLGSTASFTCAPSSNCTVGTAAMTCESGTCTFECSERHDCTLFTDPPFTITCKTGTICNVNCNNWQSCSKLNINALDALYLTVTTTGTDQKDQLDWAVITCPDNGPGGGKTCHLKSVTGGNLYEYYYVVVNAAEGFNDVSFSGLSGNSLSGAELWCRADYAAGCELDANSINRCSAAAEDNNPSYSASYCETYILTPSPTAVTASPSAPTAIPSSAPTAPSNQPTEQPTYNPTTDPSQDPTQYPTTNPSLYPTTDPSQDPTKYPTVNPTVNPTINPTVNPTINPTVHPTTNPTVNPTVDPTTIPTVNPTVDPTTIPTVNPTTNPSLYPTKSPSNSPTNPTEYPSSNPTDNPTTLTQATGDVNEKEEKSNVSVIVGFVFLGVIVFAACVFIGVVVCRRKKKMEAHVRKMSQRGADEIPIVKAGATSTNVASDHDDDDL